MRTKDGYNGRAAEAAARAKANRNRRIGEAAQLRAEIAKLRAALQAHVSFINSLPSGWLRRTCGNVGLLNEALLKSAELGIK